MEWVPGHGLGELLINGWIPGQALGEILISGTGPRAGTSKLLINEVGPIKVVLGFLPCPVLPCPVLGRCVTTSQDRTGQDDRGVIDHDRILIELLEFSIRVFACGDLEFSFEKEIRQSFFGICLCRCSRA